jgi:hypothetical protein
VTLVTACVSRFGVMATFRSLTLPVLLTTTVYVTDSPAGRKAADELFSYST